MDIFFCDLCQKKVRAYGDIAFSLFEFICESYFKNYPLEICTDSQKGPYDFLQIIYFLESKGLVITTESSLFMIQVKPLGFDLFVDDIDIFAHFCVHKHKAIDCIGTKKTDGI